MSKEKEFDLAGDAAMALYILGDKLAGDTGTKLANGINVLLNRKVGPCSVDCEHSQPER
ncbi:hypothetical protein [Streptomyces sp. NPDC001389]|uniref:hypothetical protein n=1 Tax=Streptomyces sp. NPDC001389 TaxID=3364569 RepID=UPI0036B0F91C